MTASTLFSWQWKTFSELTAVQVYRILRLRSEVFVVEQDCVYADIDNKDSQATHLLATRTETSEMVGYCRVFEPGVEAKEAVIGRIVTAGKVRRQGVGRAIVQKAIQFCDDRFAEANQTCLIRIAAQSYLKPFYERLGFDLNGDEYVEDGIPHVPMVRRLP